MNEVVLHGTWKRFLTAVHDYLHIEKRDKIDVIANVACYLGFNNLASFFVSR
jgi:hypothetical protein